MEDDLAVKFPGSEDGFAGATDAGPLRQCNLSDAGTGSVVYFGNTFFSPSTSFLHPECVAEL